MEKEIKFFTKAIFNSFLYWYQRLDVNRPTIYEADTINKKIKEIVTQIVRNNNQYLLTEDMIRYLSFNGFCNYNFEDEFLKKYQGLIDLDFTKSKDLIITYFQDLAYSQIIHKFDNVAEYYHLMNDKTRNIFLSIVKVLTNLSELSLNDELFVKVRDLLLSISSNCLLNDDIDLFNKIMNKYFNDLPNAIERFKVYGVITEDNTTPIDFFEFIKFDLDNNQEVITK